MDATTGIAGFFGEIANGLEALLPGVAGSAVSTIDTLMYTSDGTLTTFAQLGIIGTSINVLIMARLIQIYPRICMCLPVRLRLSMDSHIIQC